MSHRSALHPWKQSVDKNNLTYSRSLATPELILAILHDFAQGHNCPYLGVTISVTQNGSSGFSASVLEARLKSALKATRWIYPSIAAQVIDNKQLRYKVEDAAGIEAWADRTVVAIEAGSGWIPKYEQLSKEDVLPTSHGDCAMLYLILDPQQANQAAVTQFDLLLHVHHALVDGAGLRSLMNAVLQNLVDVNASAQFAWGDETDRLTPAAIDVAIMSDEAAVKLEQSTTEVELPPLMRADGPRHGTGVVMHTFQDAGFLGRLRAVGRDHDVKLTAMLQAALLTVLYSAVKPTQEEYALVVSGFDLRARDLMKPWNERNSFIGAAVGLEMVKTPVSQFKDIVASGNDEFWTLTQAIQEEWTGIVSREDVAAAGELRRPNIGFPLQIAMTNVHKEASKLDLACNYVSDPPGSDQLDGVYVGHGESLTLESYQLVSNESTPKLSCRSHSWNNKLTMEISFSYKHHKRQTAQGVLDNWALALESLIE